MKNGKKNKSWIKPHVDGHFLFGLYRSKHKVFWIIITLILYFSINWAIDRPGELNTAVFSKYILNTQHLVAVCLIVYFAFFANLSQSIIFWVSTKITLAFMSFVLVIAGVVDIFRDGNEWVIYFSMGILWFPSVEFHTFFMKYQKLISIFRLLLTAIVLNSIY